jgi:hypothetical protein
MASHRSVTLERKQLEGLTQSKQDRIFFYSIHRSAVFVPQLAGRWITGYHRPGFTPTLKGAPDDDGLGLSKLLKSKYWNPFSLAPVQGRGKTEKMNENNWTIF